MNERHDEARGGIFVRTVKVIENFRALPRGEEASLLLLLFFLLTLAFVVPTYVHFVPYGTDVYGHLFFTRQMKDVNSLNDFYKHCLEEGYLRYDYPFGLWLFGSIVAKVTGMNMLELAQNVPFVIMLILSVLYFSYARIFGASKKESLLSVAFLLSMPILCTGILGYSTSVFVKSFLIFILFLMLSDKISQWKRYLLMNVFIFTLCFTHTGTYMFLLSLTLIFTFMYALLYGEIHRDVYIATASIMFIYTIVMHLFPYVHPQYISKGRILVSVGDFLTSDLHIPFSSELGRTFYEHIFINLDSMYVVLWCLSMYAACRFIIFIRSKFKVILQRIREKFPRKFFSVPVIGGIRHISHSVLYTPFWLGPVHTVLAAIGAFKTNKNGLCMLLSVAVVTLIPGYMAGEGGTGALREIGYFFVIIPVLSALGFYYVKEIMEVRMIGKLRKAFAGALLLMFSFSVVVLPVIGNLYYHPLISGTSYERQGLYWLSNIGKPSEGCAGYGYRHMISVYGKKNPVSVTTIGAGAEMSRFEWDQYSACFQMDSEKYTDDLYATFGVKYLIVSERTMRNFGEKPWRLRADYNKQLDKIYSSIGYFSIYKYITSLVHRTDIAPQLNFADDAIIKDAGDTYLVDTGIYKVRIGKADPGIRYIGNKTVNFLGDYGLYYDYLKISWGIGPYQEEVNGWALHEISFPTVILGRNQIIYKTILKNVEGTENWATLTVKYSFFEKAMKREIIISNDWINSDMYVDVTMGYFSPLRYFYFQLDDNPPKKKTMYPCEDEVPLKKLKFNRMFINNGVEGIYIKFENTAPYPDAITYTGLTDLNYSYYTVSMHLDDVLSPAESMHITQWISIGDDKTARNNVEHYTSVSLYPYPRGEIPIILMSRIDAKGDFTDVLGTHERFKDMGVVNYTEAVDIQELYGNKLSKLKDYDIVGLIKAENITEEQIKRIKINAQEHGIKIRGIIPKGLHYDLNAVKVLSNENITFILSEKIPPAFDIYYQEGMRRPKRAYYHGEQNDVILMPISEPIIGGPTYFYDDYAEAWKAVIDSAIRYDDMVIFLWDSDKACNPVYLNDTVSVIKYAKDKGLTFTTPYEVAKYFQLLKNIYALVSMNENEREIKISIENRNKEAVNGVTVRIKASGNMEVNGGKIIRKRQLGNNYFYYVSVDLSPFEKKEIYLRSSSS